MTPPPNNHDSATIPTVDSTPSESHSPGPDKLQAIRELLIGDEFHGIEQRFGAFEQSLEERHAKLRNEFLSEFRTLQAQGKAEVKDLGEMVVEMVGQLQREDASHSEGIEAIETRLTAMEKRIDGMAESLSQQVQRYHEEFSGKMAELSRTVKTQQEHVARQALTRADLSGILSGMAGSLTPQEPAAQEPAAQEAEPEPVSDPFHPG